MIKKFSLRRKTVPLEIEHVDGTVHQYELREPNAKTRDAWMAANRKRTTRDAAGNVLMSNMDGMQASLLTITLFDVAANAFVSVDALQDMPATMQTELYQLAEPLVFLTDKAVAEAQEEAKKE